MFDLTKNSLSIYKVLRAPWHESALLIAYVYFIALKPSVSVSILAAWLQQEMVDFWSRLIS